MVAKYGHYTQISAHDHAMRPLFQAGFLTNIYCITLSRIRDIATPTLQAPAGGHEFFFKMLN